jgi:hypothetical protein
VSIANQRYFQWMARISHSLSPARSRNGSCWFAVSDQAEKNRPVKNVILEKKGDCMRKVIVTMWVTLDGFIAGPNGEMDWVMVDDEMGKYEDDLVSAADTLILGSVTYQSFAGAWPHG